MVDETLETVHKDVNKEEVEFKVKKIVAKALGLSSKEKSTLNDDSNLIKDFRGFNDLALLEIIEGIEKEFKINIFADLKYFTTFKSFTDYVVACLS